MKTMFVCEVAAGSNLHILNTMKNQKCKDIQSTMIPRTKTFKSALVLILPHFVQLFLVRSVSPPCLRPEGNLKLFIMMVALLVSRERTIKSLLWLEWWKPV